MVVAIGCATLAWVFALVSVGKAVRLWRDPRLSGHIEAYSIVGVGMSKSLRRGAARGFVPMAVAMIGCATLLTCAIFVGSAARHNSPAVLVAIAGLALLLGGFLLIGCIALFNRPKFLLPPYLRSEVGAATEWMRSMWSGRSHAGRSGGWSDGR